MIKKILAVLAVLVILAACSPSVPITEENTTQPNLPEKPVEKPAEPAEKPSGSSASLIINEVSTTSSGLGSIRVTVDNGLGYDLAPEFDISVYENGNRICYGGSVLLFGTVANGEAVSGDIGLRECSLEKGIYKILVELMDVEFNKYDNDEYELILK
ncbi:hypothetical protein JXC34_07425 [Candidatus Woesearchaeota archaeon]|nr:hypothetical protein [Candidatus Woesearchaeota archaeon]